MSTEKIQRAIQTIFERDGHVTAVAVVDAARPKSSPLHPRFEWDDSKAAEEFRLVQARTLIRTVKVIYGDQEERLINVPAIEPRTEGVYQVAPVIRQNPNEYERAMTQAVQHLQSAKSAVEDLAGHKHKKRVGAALALAASHINSATEALSQAH